MAAKKLLTAAKNNKFKELSIYLASENDEDVNTKDDEGWTLVHYAVINENIDMVQVLLKNGADPTQSTNEGDIPLHLASRKGSLEIVSILLKHASACKMHYINTKTTFHEDTPLHVAARNGFTNIVKMLLSKGAIYNIKNKENQTPFDLSKAYSVREILNLIEECFGKARKGDLGIVETLKDASLDEFSAIVNARNCNNQPLIQEAMVNHHHKLTAKLLEVSIDTDSYFSYDERRVAIETLPQTNVSSTTIKTNFEDLKSAAENHLSFSKMYLSMLKSMSAPYGPDQNPLPWKTLKEGSYLLGNTEYLLNCYKKYNPGKIQDQNIKLVNDTLVYLQFDRTHISKGYTPEAYNGDTECFVSKGEGTVYYNMLHSDLNKDVRLFIDIVEKNIDTPVKKFLDTIIQKLKTFS